MKIALIAHDGKKADIVAFVMKRLEFFTDKRVKIVATQSTGQRIMYSGVNNIETVNSGPKGGDAEIAAMVAKHELDAVLFFRDPLDKHPHEPDVQMLLRVCDVHEIPLATNYSTAKILIDNFIQKLNV
jgi:methylglyoxal synthase